MHLVKLLYRGLAFIILFCNGKVSLNRTSTEDTHSLTPLTHSLYSVLTHSSDECGDNPFIFTLISWVTDKREINLRCSKVSIYKVFKWKS